MPSPFRISSDLTLALDEAAGMMWGDLGFVYFWIRDADLRAGAFENAWAILQCG